MFMVQEMSNLVQDSSNLVQETLNLVQDSSNLVQETSNLDQDSSSLVQEPLNLDQDLSNLVEQNGFYELRSLGIHYLKKNPSRSPGRNLTLGF